MSRKPSLTIVTSLAVGIAVALVSATKAQEDADSERAEYKKTHAYKEYSWVDQRAGDCHMSGILTIFDDGYAIWTASSKTDSTTSGDIWHESLEVLDSNNKRLFGFGEWDSPRMFEGSQYNWRKTDRFPAGFFSTASSANSSGDC